MRFSFHGMWGLKEAQLDCAGPIIVLSVSDPAGDKNFSFNVRELKIHSSGQNSHRIQVDHPVLLGRPLIVSDLNFINYLKSQRHPQIYEIEMAATSQKRQFILKWLIPLFILVILLLGIPTLVQWAPSQVINLMISNESEKSIRKYLMATFKGKIKDNKSEILLTEMITDLKAVNPNLSDNEVEVLVSDNPEVNAFALPGGLIMVNQGLIEDAKTIEEIAGVLGHELGHVVLRHTTKAFINGLGTSAGFLLLSLTFGIDAGQTLMSGINLLRLSFSREQELQADAFASDLLRQNGISNQGLVDFFARLKANEAKLGGKAISMLSTHPPSSERVTQLIELQKKSPQKIRQWDSKINLSEIKKLSSQ